MAVDPSNTIVTVNFEVKTNRSLGIVQCPIGFPEFIRFPITKGMFGFVAAVDTYMGGMSGLGKGTATFSQLPNLSTLVWFPCGHIGNTPTDDPAALVAYGPNGVVLRDSQSKCIFKLTPNGIQITLNGVPLMTFSSDGIALTYGGAEIGITSSGININGVPVGGTTVDGQNFLPHSHVGVQTGGGTSGPVS